VALVRPPYTRESPPWKRALSYCRLALADRPDIILFPEIWNIGFADVDLPVPERLALLNELSVRDFSEPFIAEHLAFARNFGVAIALGVLRQVEGKLFDSLLVIGREGEVNLVYDKVHTCDFDFEAYFQAGSEFNTTALDLGGKTIKTGCMICYDREFPESARALMLNGAELVLTANCCFLDDKRMNQFQARAFENATVMAMANYAAPLNGRSCIVAADGHFVVVADDSERVVTGEVSVQQTRSYRAACGWGNAFRRPSCYGRLAVNVDIPAFQRINFRGEPIARGRDGERS
jgi:N-carbamoylputrescine amidase